MTDVRRDPKPAHWSAAYARQFEDESVASAYHTRPPYPPELFELLAGLFPPGERTMLDLGCGTGDIALGMLGRADRIDAVDPSRAMLRIAAGREGAAHASLRWSCAMAEEFDFGARYSLVVAAESVHWMEWDLVLPRMARSLVPGGFFAIVSGRSLMNVPWSAELAALIPRFSTNRDYRRQDEVAELKRRGSFDEVGRRTLSPAAFSQSVDDYVESFHTRNGFSRQRMTLESAAGFDRELRQILARYCPHGIVQGDVAIQVVWGVPRDPREMMVAERSLP